MRKVKNVPKIKEVIIKAPSKEKYDQFIHAVKMIIIEDIKQELKNSNNNKDS
jgi:hypothetical protein